MCLCESRPLPVISVHCSMIKLILRHHRPDFKINLMIENDASCHLIVTHCKLPYFVSSCIISRRTTDQTLMKSRRMIHFCTSCQIFKLAHKCYSFSSRQIYKCSAIKGVNMFIVAWLELAKRLKERILWWWWKCLDVCLRADRAPTWRQKWLENMWGHGGGFCRQAMCPAIFLCRQMGVNAARNKM